MFNYVWWLFFIFYYIWLSKFFWSNFSKHIHYRRCFCYVRTIQYTTFWIIKSNIHQLTNLFSYNIDRQFKHKTWSIFCFFISRRHCYLIEFNFVLKIQLLRKYQENFCFFIFLFFVYWFLNSFSIRHFYFIEYNFMIIIFISLNYCKEYLLTCALYYEHSNI